MIGCRAGLQVGLSEVQGAALKVGAKGAIAALEGGVTGVLMDYFIAGVVALLLFGYLVYALLRPEKF